MQEPDSAGDANGICRTSAAVRTGSEHAHGPSSTMLSRAPPGWLVACTSAGCCCCSGNATFCSAEGGCPGSGRCGDPMLDTDSSSAEPTDCSAPNTSSVLVRLAPGCCPSGARCIVLYCINRHTAHGESRHCPKTYVSLVHSCNVCALLLWFERLLTASLQPRGAADSNFHSYLATPPTCPMLHLLIPLSCYFSHVLRRKLPCQTE